jgi:hypothetical protein
MFIKLEIIIQQGRATNKDIASSVESFSACGNGSAKQKTYG